MPNEREIGQILEGVKNLQDRYGNQEQRLDRVEHEIASIRTTFAKQPSKCLQDIESKFVTKETMQPFIDTQGIVKKVAIFMFCSALGCIAVLLIAISEGWTP